MKINMDSRFGRYLKFLDTAVYSETPASLPTNICSMFWYVLFGSLYAFAMGTILLVFGSLLIAGIYGTIVYPLYPILPWIQIFPNHSGGPFWASVIWCIMAYLGILFYRTTDHYKDAIHKQYERKRERVKHENIVQDEPETGIMDVILQFLKDKKNKVCTPIEYE